MVKQLRDDEIINKIPNYMKLPIPGFINKNHHLMLMKDSIFSAIKKNFTNKGVLFTGLMHGIRFYKLASGEVSVMSLYNLAGLFNDILEAGNIYAHLQTMHFTGIQSINTGMGITSLKDNRINYLNPEESMHVVLSPYEFIIYDKPVHAVADGVVKEIVDKYQDNVNTRDTIDITGYLEDKNLYGNYIDIEHNEVITSRYACMRLHGFTKKVGDKIKQGEIIGRVGASNAFKAPELLFQLMSPKKWYDYPGKIKNIREYAIKGMQNKWDMHMEAVIINRTDYEAKYLDKWEQFRQTDLRTLKYYYVSSYLNPGCLIKQTQNILSE